MIVELRWWLVQGDYAGALVAAASADEARAMLDSGVYPWADPEVVEATDRPGPPTAPGVYHEHAG